MKKATIILTALLFMIIVVLLIFQKSAHQNHTFSHSFRTTSEAKPPIKRRVDSPQNIQETTKKTILSVPAPYHPIKEVLQQTIYVGTRNHPTINGGIINAPGVVVSRDLPESITAEKKPTNEPHVLLASNNVEKASTNNSEFFQDNWATTERVGRITSAQPVGRLFTILNCPVVLKPS